jgi:hypothetical protein
MKNTILASLVLAIIAAVSTASFAGEPATQPATAQPAVTAPAAEPSAASSQTPVPVPAAAPAAEEKKSAEPAQQPPAPDKNKTLPPEPELPISPCPWEGVRAGKVFQFNMELLSMVQWLSNSDFDPKAPYYNEKGQQVGILGTFFKPMFALKFANALRFYYEAEIGLDLWAYKNPDMDLAGQVGVRTDNFSLGFKQREIYGEAIYKGFAAKAGFQRIIDPSQLFVNFWIGAARFSYDDGDKWGLTLTAGQIPSQNYWGWDFQDNSFSLNTLLYGIDARAKIYRGLKGFLAVYWVDDLSVVGHRRQTGAIEAKLLYEEKDWHVSLSGVYEFGYRQRMGADGSNIRLNAGAAIAEGEWKSKWVSIQAVATLMTGDNAGEGNDSTAFLYSGRRPGPTTFLTENDMRALGDNLDIKVGTKDGNFYEMRAGLAGFDLAVWIHPTTWVKLGPVGGYLGVLQPINALGGSLVAVETELQVIFMFFNDAFEIQLTGGALFPGTAGAAYINRIDKTATDPIGFVQGGLYWKL